MYSRNITNQDAGKLDGNPDYVSPPLRVWTTDIGPENREDVNPFQIVGCLALAAVGEVGIRKIFVCYDNISTPRIPEDGRGPRPFDIA